MNIQIFPNWFKKVSIFIFVGSSVVAGLMMDCGGEGMVLHDKSFVFEVVAILGIIGFMLSKERVEDEYIKLLRYESHQIAFILVVLLALFIDIYKGGFSYNLSYLLETYFYMFLIVYYLKSKIK